MLTVHFSQGQFSGEDALIQELSKQNGTEQSILQQCNDGNKLIYARFESETECDPLQRKLGVVSNMNYLLLKRALRATKTIGFVTVDTMRDEYVIPLSEPHVKELVLVGELEKGRGGGEFVFWGEGINDVRKGLLKDFKGVLAVVFTALWVDEKKVMNMIFPCVDMIGANKLVENVKEIFGGGKKFKVSGMEIKEVETTKVGYDVVKNFLMVNEYSIFDDNFADVAELIPKINSWEDISIWRDLKTREPFYDREVNELLMYNVCYVCNGRAVFNLILSGLPSTAKTSAVTEYARIFEDSGKIVQAQGATTKGLIPSFAGDVPKPGYLASPGFLKVIDEIFRHTTSQRENKGMNRLAGPIDDYLSKLLPILTRLEQNVPSGKDQEFNVLMTAALLATDNLKDDIRIALSNLVGTDPAILRRFTIVYLGKSEWERMKRAKIVPSSDQIHGLIDQMWKDQYGCSVSVLKRFASWFRKEVSKVEVDSGACLEIADEMVKSKLVSSLGGSILNNDDVRLTEFARRIDFIDHVRALVQCSALMRVVYETKECKLPRKVVVEEIDHVTARRIFKRILDDCMAMFSQSIYQTLTTDTGEFFGGVRRK